MPNLCSYDMKVQGAKRNVEEFINIMNAKDYSTTHLYRVFEAELYNELINEDGTYSAYIYGTCAWSVHTSMTEYGYFNKSDDQNGTHLRKESERLNLAIEVYSEECGMAFAERYVFIKGEEVVNECIDREEYCTEEYETVEEMNEDLNTNFTKAQFEGLDYIVVGGYGEYEFEDYSHVFNTAA